MLRLIIYGVMAWIWLFTFAYDFLYVPVLPLGGIWFMKLRFLTYINFICQTIYSCLCVVRAFVDRSCEVRDVGPHRVHPAPPTYYPTTKLHRMCDRIYATVIFPVGMLVVGLFWALFYIDRELVYPEYLDKVIPMWVNHVLHVYPAPFVLIDSLLVCHRYPPRVKGVATVTAFAILYEILYVDLVNCRHVHFSTGLLRLIVNYLITGYWMYGIFSTLNSAGKGLFFLFAIVVVNVLYLIGEGYNQLIWGTASFPPDGDQVQESSKRDIEQKKVR